MPAKGGSTPSIPRKASGPDKLWSDPSLDKINTEGLQLEHCANVRLSASCPTGLETCQEP
jgi:hypothetical protein